MWHSPFCPTDYNKESYGTAISVQSIKESYVTAISAQCFTVKGHMAQLFPSNGLQYRIICHSYFCPMDYSKESYGTAISAQWITAKRQVAQLLLLSGLQYTIA
jgi:hypothetical protein